ncbi:MAG: hydrogenase expression/formation protein HypE [Thermovirgaceae bacterium]
MGRLSTGHGAGGRLGGELISEILLSFGATGLEQEDCAIPEKGLAITIDGFTVTPRVFPGGDIGKLAVCGSINDLAMRGAKPKYLAMSLVAEEGLEKEELLSYMKSAGSVCTELSVRLVSGDTKVVPSGQVDGLFITTCAVGNPVPERSLGIARLEPGDALIVTTSIGRHGAAVAASRYNLSSGSLLSDCAPLWHLAEDLLDIPGLRCMRDCTRGGLGTVLCEWAEAASLGVLFHEKSLPVSPEVKSVCDILGFDPLYLACEGCAVIAVDPEDAEKTLDRLRAHEIARDAECIGSLTSENPGYVGMRTEAGGTRLVDMPVGEILPRIC